MKCTTKELRAMGIQDLFVETKCQDIKPKTASYLIKKYANKCGENYGVGLYFIGSNFHVARAMSVLGKMLIHRGSTVFISTLDYFFDCVCQRNSERHIKDLDRFYDVDFLFFSKLWKADVQNYGITDGVKVSLTSLLSARESCGKPVLAHVPCQVSSDEFRRIYGNDIAEYFINFGIQVELPLEPPSKTQADKLVEQII